MPVAGARPLSESRRAGNLTGSSYARTSVGLRRCDQRRNVGDESVPKSIGGVCVPGRVRHRSRKGRASDPYVQIPGCPTRLQPVLDTIRPEIREIVGRVATRRVARQRKGLTAVDVSRSTRIGVVNLVSVEIQRARNTEPGALEIAVDCILSRCDEVRLPIDELATEERSEERRVGKECRSRWSPYH